MTVERGTRFEGDAVGGALDAIVDYRGDVSITRTDGAVVSGYVFACDRREGETVIRLLPDDGGARVVVPLDAVAALEVTGRDTAEGKSFETWVRKYLEKRGVVGDGAP